MHNQLEMLMEIQDLKTQRQELGAASAERDVETEVFQMSPEEAVATLSE